MHQIAPEAGMNDGVSKPKYQEHELKSMADTIMQAHEHMADPALMKMLKPHLDKKVKAVRSIADLKHRANMSSNESQEGAADSPAEELKDLPGEV